MQQSKESIESQKTLTHSNPINLLDIFKEYGDTPQAYESIEEEYHLAYAFIVAEFNHYVKDIFESAEENLYAILEYEDLGNKSLLEFIQQADEKMFLGITDAENGGIVIVPKPWIRQVLIDQINNTFESKEDLIDEFIRTG